MSIIVVSNGLSDKERNALQLVSEGLIKIRQLATQGITVESYQAIYELADALHNIPRIAACTESAREQLNSLLDDSLEQAANIYRRNGWQSHWLKIDDQ